MKTCEHKTRARYESLQKQVCIDCGKEFSTRVQLLKVSELAKNLSKHRNQIRGLILKLHVKPVETRPNIYGGITNFYRIEDFLNENT